MERAQSGGDQDAGTDDHQLSNSPACGLKLSPNSAHVGGAEEHAASANVSEQSELVCKHWKRRGFCAWGDTCRFAHPPDLVGEATEMKSRRTKKKGNANVVMKGSRAFAFRRFIQDNFFDSNRAEGRPPGSREDEGGSREEGRQASCSTKPVRIVDVAGGQGELSFELLNASALIPDEDGSEVIVLDPRPALRFDSFIRRWERGMYAWNEVWRDQYNARAPARDTAAPLAPTDSLRMPVHWRVHCEAPLVLALNALHSQQAPPPPQWRERAQEWWESNLQRAEKLREVQEEEEEEEEEAKRQGDVKSRGDVSVEAVESHAEGAKSHKQPKSHVDMRSGCSLLPPPCGCSSSSPQHHSRVLPPSSLAPHASLDLFLAALAPASLSLLVAMHPDEATEPLLDLALSQRIPFALVPCCVFPRMNPHRRLKNGGTVASYPEFVAYLQEKDTRIRSAVLDFQGRNTVLYMTEAMFSEPVAA